MYPIRLLFFLCINILLLSSCQKEVSEETGANPGTPVNPTPGTGSKLHYTLDTVAGFGLGGLKFQYDAAGRYTFMRLAKVNANGVPGSYTSTFTRNANGRITRVYALDSTYDFSGVLEIDTLIYFPHYDAAGRIDWYKSDTINYPAYGKVYDSTTITRNAAGQPVSITFSEIAYDILPSTGLPPRLVYTDVSHNYEYNAVGDLITIKDGIYVGVRFTYDNKNSPNQITEEAVFNPELMYNISPHNVTGITEWIFPVGGGAPEEALRGNFVYTYQANNYPASFKGKLYDIQSGAITDSAVWHRKYVYYP
jgi:hypothetical protein